jgi:primosomal protein N' (replication factor Y)
MDERKTLFVDLILPVPIRNLFTYRVPYELNDVISMGQRVIVPFGKNKRITGIVAAIHENAPSAYQAKYLEFILDDKPILSAHQLHFWHWIAEYYLAPIGDVMAAALPANFKLASETKVVLHPDYDGTEATDEHEKLILETLAHREQIDLKELSEILEVKNIQIIIKRLIERRCVMTQEEINQRYTPKTKTFIQINPNYSEADLSSILEELNARTNTQGQLHALLRVIQLLPSHGIDQKYLEKKLLLSHEISPSSLSALEKKGIITQEKLRIDRVGSTHEGNSTFPVLSHDQSAALHGIETSWKEKDITLLHGVTGSGKTEIYIHLIQSYLDLGKQILLLIPEIALTTQLIHRLEKYFGKQLGVYHSKFNQNERVEIWNKVHANHPDEFRVIIGARSSVFLPFQDLGLVIVDEEHESSYKQHDPSPRYHGRDASIYLARMFKAKVLLGSATPSLESYQNTLDEKYGYVRLDARFGDISMPEILIANTLKETAGKSMTSHFSSLLIEQMTMALGNKEQVILFQNRRGYTPYWSCEICGWIPKCDACDVSLTYHKHVNLLKCHYCGYTNPPMGSCGACGSHKLKMQGFGTEKIEDELAAVFPEAKIARMDLDTTRSKHAYSELITRFEDREIDVLIGTQMLSKGLDFDHVTLVGILDADHLLNRPDFRAYERGFQLMTQVAGRAGRKNKRGKVVIQTKQPDHWVLQLVTSHDTIAFIKNELIERKNFNYPPFTKLLVITLKHADEHLLSRASLDLAMHLKNALKERVLGPEFPIVKRIQNQFQKEIKLKYEKTLSDKKIKEHLLALLNQFYETVPYKTIKVSIDVDAY